MKNVITILISLGFVLCGQTAFGQTQAKKDWSKATWQTEKAATQAEVEAQIKEASSAKDSNGQYAMKTDPNKPGRVYVNGKEYKRDRTKYPEVVRYMENGKRIVTVHSEKGLENPVQRTYVNGKDTIQVRFTPPQEGREIESGKAMRPNPGSELNSRVSSDDGKSTTKSFKSEDGKSYFAEKHTSTPQETYSVRFKGNTSHAPSRADIQGSRFQAVNNTDIAKTFGNELKDSNVYGSDALYGKN